MGRQGTERSTRAVRLDAQLTNWECSPVKEQQVSTSEINTRRHRRELPKAAPRSKDRTFRRSRLIDAARGLFHEKGFAARSEEHTSELQSLMRISYAVFCLKKKQKPAAN